MRRSRVSVANDMKVRMIELKTLPFVDGDLELNYREVLLAQLNRVDPQKGLSYDDIEKRLELRRSLKDAGDTWLIANDKWEEVKALLKAEKWQVVSENLMTFIGDVNAATEVDVNDHLRLVNASAD